MIIKQGSRQAMSVREVTKINNQRNKNPLINCRIRANFYSKMVAKWLIFIQNFLLWKIRNLENLYRRRRSIYKTETSDKFWSHEREMSLGIPIKVLHEAEGHVITCESSTGEVYRGKLIEAEEHMNLQVSI